MRKTREVRLDFVLLIRQNLLFHVYYRVYARVSQLFFDQNPYVYSLFDAKKPLYLYGFINSIRTKPPGKSQIESLCSKHGKYSTTKIERAVLLTRNLYNALQIDNCRQCWV